MVLTYLLIRKFVSPCMNFSTFSYRRPTTGKCEANTIKAAALLSVKEKLQKHLESLEEESANLKSSIKKFQKETEHQLAEIHSLEQIHKDDF